ncbi:MAG TPA: flavin reductase family protein [Spirochaetota bacterium]|jgi:flavin reductase (DIM6/NTAB) family NADH-FMN oxidoreductase RutF|nr:flavin reductase family protein [Spirochaetota bacterium]
MAKITWKPGTMIYPVPAVMVSCGREGIGFNIITVSWTGTICTNPPMTYISLRRDRFSYEIIKDCGDFVINLSTEALAFATDFCGVRSGREVDKFAHLGLMPGRSSKVNAPLILESPVNIECIVKEIVPLGSHDMFISEVVAVNVDDQYIDSNGKFSLERAKPICYNHGAYFSLGKNLGHFGFSVIKEKTKKRKEREKILYKKHKS